MLLNGSPESAGPFSVDNSYAWNMCQISIIQIFVEMPHCLIDSHADQVDLGTDKSGLGHPDLTASRHAFGCGEIFCLSDEFQITYIDLGTENAHLNKKIPFCIWQGTDCSFQIQT